jgi:hypothetical protein
LLWIEGVALLLLPLLVGCGDVRAVPPVDVRYSELLSVLGDNYRAISGTDSSATVAVLQIFSRGGDDVSSLRNATQGQLLFESRQREVIDRLITAVQQRELASAASCDFESGPTWILVAYDSALFRAAVIRLYICGSGDEAVLGIRPVGDAAITYSRNALSVLESLHLSNPDRGDAEG